jgi:hypothetical protein
MEGGATPDATKPVETNKKRLGLAGSHLPYPTLPLKKTTFASLFYVGVKQQFDSEQRHLFIVSSVSCMLFVANKRNIIAIVAHKLIT